MGIVNIAQTHPACNYYQLISVYLQCVYTAFILVIYYCIHHAV